MGLLKAFFRAVISIFVVVAGLVATLAMAAVAAILFMIGRSRAPAGRVAGERTRRLRRTAGDVIAVDATEVSADPEKTA